MTRVLHIAIAALCVASCDGGAGAVSGRPGTIGGSVTGLRGTGLVLQNNGGDPLTIGADGSFTFATPFAPFAPYSVTVQTQPTATPAEFCSVASGNGSIRRGPVTNVSVTCHTATGKFLYTANQLNTVSGFSIDPITGALTEIPGSPFAINGYPPEGYPYEGLYVDKTGKFLFVAGSTGGGAPEYSLTGYVIDSATGALTQIPGMPITSHSSFMRAFFHPNGRAMYLPAASDGLRAYSIHPTSGAFTPVPGEPYRFSQDWWPRRGGFDPSGSTLFVGSGPRYSPGGSDQPPSRVSAFAVDPTTGTLTLQGTVDYSGRPGDIVVHSSGKYAYMWFDGPLAVIGIENPASLTVANAAPMPPVGGAVFGLPVGAILEGEHAYFGYAFQILIGGRPAYLVAYRVDTASGALTPVAGSPYIIRRLGGGEASGFVMDPTRRYIVATTFFSPNIAVFERDPATGELEHAPGSPFTPTVGTTPLGVTFDPSGKFAYIPDGPSFSVSAYSFDSTNGRLDFIGSYPVGSRPVTLARIAGLQ